MKILVIFTGGTIGSSLLGSGYITPKDEKNYMLLEMYKKNPKRKDISFETVEPYSILSENLDGEYINILSKCVCENVKKDFDGIIVTHGTDTLQYTAAALSYSVGNRCIPVVLVSSDFILTDKRQNGEANFYYAAEFIYQKGGRGVFAVSGNAGENPTIHRASRLLGHSEFSNEIKSVFGEGFGYFADDKFYKNKEFKECEDEIQPFGALSCKRVSGVEIVYLRPGFSYPPVPEGTKAVLHFSYHSGTVCTKSRELERFCSDLKQRNIPLFLCGSSHSVKYESTKEFGDLGFSILLPASEISMYVKLWIITSQNLSLDILDKSLGGDVLKQTDKV